MEVTNTMGAAELLRKYLAEADPDLLRSMVQSFAEALMSADASGLCNAGYGEVTADRVNSRNGYRSRRWDTRAGTIDLAIPKLRSGSYFPDWLIEARRRADGPRSTNVNRTWHSCSSASTEALTSEYVVLDSGSLTRLRAAWSMLRLCRDALAWSGHIERR